MDSAVDPAVAAELSLLSGLRAGSDDAYDALVQSTFRHLLTVARRILKSDADAMDAVQDAYISAFRALPRFEGHSRVSTWLHRIVVNTALMKLRRQRRRPEEPIEGLLPAYEDDGHQTIEPMAWAPERADLAFERAQTRAFVRAQVDRLPESYRTVLLLRDIEGLTTPETAAAPGISENAVKIRLHRARQALRALIDPRFRAPSSTADAEGNRP